MKITNQRLIKLGFKNYVCEDGCEGFLKNHFIWINDGQFRYNKTGQEDAVLCDDENYPINTIKRLKKLYKAITGCSLKKPRTKNTMIKVLQEVAAQRLKLNTNKLTIQLSSTLMKKAIDGVNELSFGNNLQQKEMSNEFKWYFFGTEFTIINRAYRDDTNDEDVEEVLYKFACR